MPAVGSHDSTAPSSSSYTLSNPSNSRIKGSLAQICLNPSLNAFASWLKSDERSKAGFVAIQRVILSSSAGPAERDSRSIRKSTKSICSIMLHMSSRAEDDELVFPRKREITMRPGEHDLKRWDTSTISLAIKLVLPLPGKPCITTR